MTLATALVGPFAAGLLDEDAPHGLGRGREKMPAAVPVLAITLGSTSRM